MKYARAVYVVGGVLVVAAALLGLSELGRGGASELPDLRLRDSAGQRFELGSLRGSVWVASVVGHRCIDDCPDALARLAELHDGLPAGVRLVTLVLGPEGLWPPRPAAAEGRTGWLFLRGNPVDADDEAAVRRLASEHLGFAPSRLDGLVRGTPAVLLVTVDRGGRARRRAEIAGDEADGERLAAPVVGDVDFLVTLDDDPLLRAGIHTATALLLGAGWLCIRRRLVPAHLLCMILAVVATGCFLASYASYLAQIDSLPLRGAGWSGPLYYAVLLSHAGLSALVVLPLAGTALFQAARRRFERHRAIARWVLPLWLYVSVTGVMIYSMLHVWYPGD